jgi:hypothetical protein
MYLYTLGSSRSVFIYIHKGNVLFGLESIEQVRI